MGFFFHVRTTLLCHFENFSYFILHKAKLLQLLYIITVTMSNIVILYSYLSLLLFFFWHVTFFFLNHFQWAYQYISENRTCVFIKMMMNDIVKSCLMFCVEGHWQMKTGCNWSVTDRSHQLLESINRGHIALLWDFIYLCKVKKKIANHSREHLESLCTWYNYFGPRTHPEKRQALNRISGLDCFFFSVNFCLPAENGFSYSFKKLFIHMCFKNTWKGCFL